MKEIRLNKQTKSKNNNNKKNHKNIDGKEEARILKKQVALKAMPPISFHGNSNMRDTLKLMSPILLCMPTTSEADVRGMAV